MTDLVRLDDQLLVGPIPVAAGTYLAKLAKGSRRTMAQALRTIAEDFSGGRFGAEDFPWEKLRYEHTQAIRAKLVERYAPATVNKMLSALRGVLKECWRLGKLDVEDLHRACDIAPVKGSRARKGRSLTEPELGSLVRAMRPRHRALVLFMVATGLRRAEASAVRWIDFHQNGVKVQGKGGKHRWVPIPARIVEVIDREAPGDPSNPEGLVFNITPGFLWTMLREASFEAGIEPVSPHDLRRTYATRLLGAGVDLAMVQRLMGHASPATTAAYDRRGDDAATAAVDKVFG